MAGIKTRYRVASDALSSGVFEESQRMYLNDHNEFLPLERSGLKDLDFLEFVARHLKY